MKTKYYSQKIYDKYYVTLPFDYKMGDSIVVYVKKNGLGRIDAMCSFGATVWTEREWNDMQKIRKQLDSLKRARLQ